MNPETANPIVVVEDLRLSYRAKPVLDGLTWRVAAGQVVGLLGRNGAGKTTLLEAILGMRDPRGGSVRAEPATAFIAPSDLAVFLYVCGLAACWTTFGDGPWWLLAASSTMALVPCAYLRWRGVRSAPPAWPAGRA